MKNRLLWVFVVVAVLSAVTLLLSRMKMASERARTEISIQDGKTIDYSSGKPVVKDTEKEKAAIEKAVKEMDEAAKGVTFRSPQPSAKKAEPSKP
jgi:hypothetical protein